MRSDCSAACVHCMGITISITLQCFLFSECEEMLRAIRFKKNNWFADFAVLGISDCSCTVHAIALDRTGRSGVGFYK